MGSYAILRIDNIVFQWKYYVPPFLSFFFEEADFFRDRRRDAGESYEEIGYRTSAGRAKAKLEAFGYNIDFLTEVYDEFHDELEEAYRDALLEELSEEDTSASKRSIDAAVRKHLARFPKQSRLKDLEDFTSFIRDAMAQGMTSSKWRHRAALSQERRADEYIERRPQLDLADFESLQMYFLERAREFPPSIMKLATLFEEAYVLEYPEVITLMYCRLLLDAVAPNADVILDLTDLHMSGMDVTDLDSAALRLAGKVHLYNRVFRPLSEREVQIGERYAKSQARSLLNELAKASSSEQKGRVLENLMELVFTSHPGLRVVEKRYSTGDEEIDLIIKNDLAPTFWVALGSPLLFVECRNWSKTLGSSHVRDFEIKVQNHRPLVKVGLIVAAKGFSRECFSELKRMSRDTYLIVPVTLEQVMGFLESAQSLPAWLEDLIVRPI